jgi:plasmid stabilization system protein ParE
VAVKIIWSPRATKTFNAIIEYLEANFTDKEISAFLRKTNRVLAVISDKPDIFKPDEAVRNAHNVVITRQTSLIYRIKKDKIELAYFWDNRRKPRRTTH